MASPVAQAWLANPVIANRASVGVLAIMPRAFLSGMDVVINAEVLAPLIKHLGLRPTVDAVTQEVQMFYMMGRPSGKPALKRSLSGTNVTCKFASHAPSSLMSKCFLR